MYKRGNKKIFNDFVKTVRSDHHRYLYIKNTLNKMKADEIDINTQNNSGNTLLHIAIKLNDLRLFKIFLDAGVNINLANENGDAPIHKAIVENKMKFVKALVNYGCDLNIGSELEQAPLHLAVISGNIEMVKYLVEHGADIQLLDETNYLPIDYAIDEKDFKMINYFLTKQEIDEERKNRIKMITEKEEKDYV